MVPGTKLVPASGLRSSNAIRQRTWNRRKKEGKENERSSTMPDVLIRAYKALKTVRVGQDFLLAEVEHKRLLMLLISFDTLRFLLALY